MPRGAATAGALAALAWAAAPGVRAAYDYGDIVGQYCHAELDWGPVPPRPAEATGLLQVQAFIRHGARVQCNTAFCWEGADREGNFTCGLDYLENSVALGGPLTPYFRTMYMQGRNSMPGNCLVGQLVEAGFAMQRRNGARLREAYVEREPFLPPTLVGLDTAAIDSTLFLRSSDVPRTKQSGMALVSGLYGEAAAGAGAQPYLPLRTMDFAEENMLVNGKLCPAVGWRGERFFQRLPAAQAREVQALCAQLEPSKKTTQDCFWWLQHLVDCMMSRICPTVPFQPRNATVPAAFLGDDAQLLRRVWKVVDEVQFAYFKAMHQAGAFGSFGAEILKAAEKVASKGSSSAAAPKLLLFSGHDTGPMEPLYAALQLRSEPPFWPAFASILILEIWNSSTGPLARWISNGEVAAGPMPFAQLRRQLGALARSEAECYAAPPPLRTAAMSAKAQSLFLATEAWRAPAVAGTSALAGALGALATLALCWRSAAAPYQLARLRADRAQGKVGDLSD